MGQRSWGPAGATLATCERVGWTMLAWNKLTAHDGDEIDLERRSPGWVRKLLTQATERWQWRQVAKQPRMVHMAGEPS